MHPFLYRVLPLVLLSFGTLTQTALADVRLPALFGDGMVLQRDQAVPVWGWADAGEEVTVTFRDQSQTATTGADGQWRVKLDPLAVGEPGTLTVKGRNSIELHDVLVGEVWVCSGQSNMGMTVARGLDADIEAAAARFPNIRLFQVPLVTAEQPQEDVKAQWRACTPESIPGFTAVGYYFGRQIHETLHVPVGLIQTAWGGTRAEAWTSAQQMAAFQPILDKWAQDCAEYDPDKAQQAHEAALATWRQRVQTARDAGRRPPARPQLEGPPRLSRHHPSNLYNAMVAPLAGYGIRGAIWYQGESNSGRAYQYRKLMPALIKSWRDAWQQGDFPFYMVQLANFKAIQPQPVESDWAELREAQMLAIDALPHVGVACITDVGAATDIHPKDKQNVGKRLARLALVNDYKLAGVTKQGPTYRSIDIHHDRIVVHFDTYGQKLTGYYNEPLTGFAIAGNDKQWVWANAKITGDDTVEVSHPDVAEPIAVRYNWADNPQGNLYSEAYLPAYPFRSDDWPGITVDKVTP